MKSFSIRLQILLIAMVPVILIDIILTSIHVNSSIDQATQLLNSKGNIIAQQIANASEFYLFSGNHEQIQHLLNESIDQEDIIYSAVYSREGELIAEAADQGYKPEQSVSYIYFRHPIHTLPIGESDVFEPQASIGKPQLRVLGWIHLYVSKQILQQNKSDIINKGMAFFIMSLLLAMLLIAIISQRITRPVFSLLEYLKKTEQGELGLVIRDVQSNEIGEVQKGFNSMSQALLANRSLLDEKIKIATHELTNAIADLEYKNRDLAIARDEAQNANRIKSQFLANISHEIRTPINGIRGFINLLSRTGLHENQKRYADIINQSTSDLSAIVNELLDFSKIESGKINILDDEFDLYEMLENTRDALFSASMEKGIDLHLTIFSDTPRLLVGDQYRLKQIMVNLIGNGIKFTDEGHVTITVQVQDEIEDSCLIQFQVKDTGIGITEKDQKSLFQAFQQIESDTNRRFSGTGLGLVISKNLARLMGGDINLQSKAGSGSLFTVTLPFHYPETQNENSNTFCDETALIISFNKRCQQEIQSLYNRVGYITETEIIDKNTDLHQLQAQLLQNLNYINLIVFDLRGSHIHPDKIFNQQLRERVRIIIMHYDLSLIEKEKYPHYEFFSIINTSTNIKNSLEFKHTEQQQQAETSVIEPNQQAAKVLLVDDNDINLALASELAQIWGHTPAEASNAHQAMQLFEQQEFDLILLDIQMPEIDGIELMKMMRQKRPDLKAPIAAITANVSNGERNRLLNSGFDAYLSKPIDEKKLKDLLDNKEILEIDPEHDLDSYDILNNKSIDFELSLKLSANNESLIIDMFEMLKEGIPEYQLQLEQAINARSLGKLAYIIHKLQGIICYIGLPRLKQHISHYQSIKHLDSEDTFKVCSDMIKELDAIAASLDTYIPEYNIKTS